ncbi:damage-inducible protein DinB [Streptomyces sp. NWU339]|uniref:DinB family protein n=1 Tax=Streptomyces sp. NWU339 TaxID=2185284 RepID=UPI000D67988A|nr:DinB family protein [Streptomyces sp. NWU339]PWI12393.1 damage-inducible protein DinB [Streptomyces sp. NWU339]
MSTPTPDPASTIPAAPTAPTPLSRTELLRWQFELTWSLFEYHLERLEPDDFLWEPTAHCWTMRRAADGAWTPDWAETEPDPVPVPTIAWVSWHIGWWWSVALDHAHGRRPRERTEVTWPGEGPATVQWLRDLRTEWLATLDGLTDTDLDATAPFPWPSDPAYTVAHTAAWVNTELLKNATEIGQLRLLRAAS